VPLPPVAAYAFLPPCSGAVYENGAGLSGDGERQLASPAPSPQDIPICGGLAPAPVAPARAEDDIDFGDVGVTSLDVSSSPLDAAPDDGRPDGDSPSVSSSAPAFSQSEHAHTSDMRQRVTGQKQNGV